jgi:hypothetical protein
MAVPNVLKSWAVCNLIENPILLVNVSMFEYENGNLRHVKLFSDNNNRLPQAEFPFSNALLFS